MNAEREGCASAQSALHEQQTEHKRKRDRAKGATHGRRVCLGERLQGAQQWAYNAYRPTVKPVISRLVQKVHKCTNRGTEHTNKKKG